MINVKELIEDFIALGYSVTEATKLAKKEYNLRRQRVIKNRQATIRNSYA